MVWWMSGEGVSKRWVMWGRVWDKGGKVGVIGNIERRVGVVWKGLWGVG